MDWIYKALLTAAAVALILTIAKSFGRRVAGILAGLPTVTGPALIWLAIDSGADYAVQASIGSIAACALCAVFALAYERASRRVCVAVALVVACVASGAVAPLLTWADHSVLAALVVAALGVWCVHAAIPGDQEGPRVRRAASGEIWMTALVSGSVSGAVALSAPLIPAFWVGVLASPPLIAAAVAAHHHAFDGSASVRSFLRGYVAGLFGRAVFGAGFAICITSAGVIAATTLAAAAAAAVSIATCSRRTQRI